MKQIMLLLAGWVCAHAYAQPTTQLTEGKQVSGDLAKFVSKHQGKYVIIDLFASTCTVCFQMMPKVNEMQRIYKDKLRFVLIGKEDGRIKAIYEKFRKKLLLSLEVYFDSTLFSKNKIDVVPLYVWINPKGLIKAITGPGDVTLDNIEVFISGHSVETKKKEIHFDPSSPYGVNGNGGDGTDFMFRSVLEEWSPGMPVSIPNRIDSPPGDTLFQAIGVTVQQLYLYANVGAAAWNYGDGLYGKVSNIVLGEVAENKKYCYSIYNKAGSAQQLLRDNLDHCFGYDVEWRVMKRPCWKLVVDSTRIQSLISMGGRVVKDHSITGFEFCNSPAGDILSMLYWYHQREPPFIDATTLDQHIDISIEADMMDLADVQQKLLSKGLQLVKGEMEMRVLVLHQLK